MLLTARVTFERIGRRTDVAPLDIDLVHEKEDDIPDVIVEHVHKYVESFLRSKPCDVDIYGTPIVDPELDEGCEILLEGGRYGKATVELVQ